MQEVLSESHLDNHRPKEGWSADAYDRTSLMNAQMKKLEEMRKRQVNFFDAKVIELQDRNAELDAKLEELQVREKRICEKELRVGDQLHRLGVEKSELLKIKDLLRVENESIILSSADLNVQIQKYEALIKLVVRTGLVPGGNN